jgi:hypothetical protein
MTMGLLTSALAAYPAVSTSSSSVYYPPSSSVSYYNPSTTSSVYIENGIKTSIAYTTEKYTVTSCAASVTNCPARSTSVYTSLQPYTSYVCKPTTVTVTTTKTVDYPVATSTASPLTQLTYWSPPKPLGGAAADHYDYPAWIPAGGDMTPGLTQNKTNGDSVLGTKDAPKYPPYLDGYKDGGKTPKDTKDVPNTGVTRKYKFVVSYKDISPDGVLKKGLVINGAFPGPTIEANLPSL